MRKFNPKINKKSKNIKLNFSMIKHKKIKSHHLFKENNLSNKML